MTKRIPQTSTLQRVKQSYRKFLISIGINPDLTWSQKLSKYRQAVSNPAPLAHSVEQLICNQQVVCSNRTRGTTTISDDWRLREGKKFTIAPAYNKGGYQVISPENIKDIGK